MEHAGVRGLLLVEGASDRTALEVLAARRGRDLDAEGVQVVAMGGATNIGHFVARHRAGGSRARVAALCDAAEEPAFRRRWERARLAGGPDPNQEPAPLALFVCIADLEDELIRALGPRSVEAAIAGAGDLRRFRSFQRQPAQRGRSAEQQLRRFMGTRSGRKAEYARLLVEALDLDRAPRPLDDALRYLA